MSDNDSNKFINIIKKIVEILFVILVTVLSLTIFYFRDRIGNVGNAGYAGLFVLCFLANSTVLLPAPSLLIASSFGLILNPFCVSAVGSLGATFGEMIGYYFGNVSADLSPKFKDLIDRIAVIIKYDFLFVFILAILPLPLFDVAGIICGGKKMKAYKFFFFFYLGKIIKMLIFVIGFKYLTDNDYIINILLIAQNMVY